MSREKKAQIIDKLQRTFARSSIVILADYRGIATPRLTVLRRRLQASNSELKVAKNTLARFAAVRAGKEGIVGSLDGPIALAFGYGDITEPAKVLASYIKESESTLSIRGGLLGDRVLTSEQVISLATLPPKEILL